MNGRSSSRLKFNFNLRKEINSLYKYYRMCYFTITMNKENATGVFLEMPREVDQQEEFQGEIRLKGNIDFDVLRGTVNGVRLMIEWYFANKGEKIAAPRILITDEVQEKERSISMPIPGKGKVLRCRMRERCCGGYDRDQEQITIYAGSIEKEVDEGGYPSLYAGARENASIETIHHIRDQTGQNLPVQSIEELVAHPQTQCIRLFGFSKIFKIGGWGSKGL